MIVVRRELSRVEMDAEGHAELPARTLMRRHRMVRHHHSAGGNSGSGAYASYGGSSNSNDTEQSNSNSQGVLNAGDAGL